MEPQLPLLRYRQFSSDNLDEVRERVGRSYCPHKLQINKRGDNLHAFHHRAPLVNTSINFLHYGAEVAIDPGEMRSLYMVEVPLAGAARVRLRGREVTSGLDRALVLSPSIPFVSVWSAECAQIMVKFNRAALERYLVELIDRPLTVPLEFDPEWNFASGPGRGFRRLVNHIMSEIEADDEFASNRALISEVERSLMAYLVHCQPSTYSDALRAVATPAAPRHIMKAIEFMRTQHDRAISIQDLAKEASVSARALHEGFKRFRSTTPMAMLKSIRLNEARQALLAADPSDRVETIAKRCGFTHLGRFSRLYFARYGELPSQTLRR